MIFFFWGEYFSAGDEEQITQKCLSEGSLMQAGLTAVEACCACGGKKSNDWKLNWKTCV